jgi:hypothetical protein
MKLKLKRRRFDTIDEIQADSQTSKNRSKNGGDGGSVVYTRERTTSRVVATHRPYGEIYDLYSVSPEYCSFTLVHVLINRSARYCAVQVVWNVIEALCYVREA